MARHGGDLHDVQALLEKATRSLVAQIVESQARDTGPTQGAPKRELDSVGGETRPVVEGGSERRTVRARLESGTPRLSPFLVMGNSAVRLFRSTLTHSTDSSSPRRIPVSSASITKCTSPGLRAARQ
jgi:hypothetical protein